MASLRIAFLAVGLLLVASISFASTCGHSSYSSMCSKCSFDNASGKVNEACWQGWQARGTACLATSYPAEMTMYELGQCPAVDVCIQRLEACKAKYASGDDRKDCRAGDVSWCFSHGDTCVANAVKDCKGTPPDTAAEEENAAFCENVLFLGFLLPLAFVFYRNEG